MSINLKMEKKDLWLLSAIMVFLIAVGYVIAYNPAGAGNPAVMGHSYNELENVQYKITTGMTACAAANQAIKTINSTTGAVTCEADDKGFASCTTLTFSGGGSNPSLLCNTGWTMTGGGCHCNGESTRLIISEPSGNGWFCACAAVDSPTEVSVRCCQ